MIPKCVRNKKRNCDLFAGGQAGKKGEKLNPSAREAPF